MNTLTDQQKIIGTWCLVSSKKTLENGQVIDMYGKNPIGYFIFSHDLMMGVQIMRRERTNFNGNALLDDYLAYTGDYFLNEQEKIMTLQTKASLSELYYLKEIKRKYHFEENKLILKVLEYPLDYILTWERVS